MAKVRLIDLIPKVADGEPIESIVLGPIGGYKYSGTNTSPELGVLMTWEEAKPHLEYWYGNGFGGAECHSLYAWTATKIIYVCEYDGSTSVRSMPRHPITCQPEYG